MKMICDRTLLANAVAGVSKAVTQRSSIPVLEGILMKAEGFSLTLTGYDLEMGITTSIEANVLEPGEVVLSAKLLGDMVRRLSSSEVEITATETNATTIKGGITEFDIMGMNPGDFPELPSPGADHTLDLETPTFREMVETTLFAVSQDDKKPAHTGELFAIEPDKLTVVALDGYRLAIIEKPVKAAKDINIIIPAKTLAEAIKLFTDDDFVVNIGPQHPSTHGVLRLQTVLDGEIVKKIYPHFGYIHRGVEKMCEKYTYPQTLALTDRLDYLSAMMNRHALCGVIEEAMGIELSDRIQYIRTIMDELQRLDSHLLYIGCCAQDLGALTAFLYSMRDREHVLNAMEETTGGRLIQNYYRIGGLQDDIDPNFVSNVKALCQYIKPMFQEYMDVFGDNVIMQNRFREVGPLSKADAISYGVSGASGRASDWHNDVRKNHPYAMYGKVDFDEVTNGMCDSMGRYLIRIEEMKQSVRIIEQLIDNIPAGDFYIKQKPIIKVPEGQWFFSCEGSRGEIGVYLDSKGDKSPYRLKFKPMGLNLVAAMDEMLRGQKVADLITTGAALDFVIPDIDR